MFPTDATGLLVGHRQGNFDTLIFVPEALRHLVAEVAISQMMVGSDYPYRWEAHPADRVLAVRSFSDADKRAILGGNSAKLFGVKDGLPSRLTKPGGHREAPP